MRESKIKTEPRQGCSPSPCLFNIDIDEPLVMLMGKTKEIKINKSIHSIRFEDIELIMDSGEYMNKILLSLKNSKFKFRIISKKTKIFIVGNNETRLILKSEILIAIGLITT